MYRITYGSRTLVLQRAVCMNSNRVGVEGLTVAFYSCFCEVPFKLGFIIYPFLAIALISNINSSINCSFLLV